MPRPPGEGRTPESHGCDGTHPHSHACDECGRLVRHDWQLHQNLHHFFRDEEARGHAGTPADL